MKISTETINVTIATGYHFGMDVAFSLCEDQYKHSRSWNNQCNVSVGMMKKILLAIEDYGIAILYEEELRDDGYEIVVSDGPESLMETLAGEDPDLVLLDIEFRGFNGLDLLWDIRHKYYDLPVILCSSYLENRYDSRAMAADYFVMHRSDLSALKLKIKMALERDTHLKHLAIRTLEKATNMLRQNNPEEQLSFKESGA